MSEGAGRAIHELESKLADSSLVRQAARVVARTTVIAKETVGDKFATSAPKSIKDFIRKWQQKKLN